VPLSAEGVAVLDPGPVGSRAGFRPGDLIRAVEGRPVESSRELDRLAGRLGRVREIAVERDGRRGVLRFR
jgi:S1-C subfamily serine protease